MKILICNDGSEQAERAIRLGCSIAAGTQAEVTLLGIVESPGKSDVILDSLKRGQTLLTEKKIQAELITKPGKPVEEIIKRTQESNYDLVVIGAVRKVSRGRFWMSSKSYKIVKAIKPPVLLVIGKSTELKKVLLCSGGRSYIDNAVRVTGELAHTAGASVTLLHVMGELPLIYANWPRVEETLEELLSSSSELGLNLRHEKETLEAAGVRVQVRLRHGAVLEEILAEAKEGGYDLVVTGSALSLRFRTYVLGDVSREIVNRANSSVLVVRSEKQ